MKRFLSLVLCVTMIATAIFSMSAVTAAEVASGECGSNLTWTLDDAGTLTISGEGYMYSYSATSAAPWAEYAQSIKNVVIEDGVLSIGKYAFAGCTALESVVLTAAYHPYIPVTEFAVDTPYKIMATNMNGTVFANSVSSSLKATPSATNARDYYLEAATTADGEPAYRFYYYYGEAKEYFYLASGSTTGILWTDTVPLYKEVVDETTGETVQGDEISTVWVYEETTGAWLSPAWNNRYLSTDTKSSREDIRCYAYSNISKAQYSIAQLAVKDPTKTEIEGVAAIYDNAFDGCTALANIYCRSTEEAWTSTHINTGNNVLAAATVTYNYTEDGNEGGDDVVTAPDALTLTSESIYAVDETNSAVIVKVSAKTGENLTKFMGNIATDPAFVQVVNSADAVQTSVTRLTTGYKVQLLGTDGSVTKTYSIILLGDMDRNGRYALADVSGVQTAVNVTKPARGSLEFVEANIDSNTRLTFADASTLQNFVVNGNW